MDDAVKSRVFEVQPEIVADLERELHARVRLSFTVRRPAWWAPWRPALVTVTGPAFALDALPSMLAELQEAEERAKAW